MHRVLIVDDEPWVAFGIANLIDWKAFDFQVIGEAYDGLSAWERIEVEQPELVVSDIRMPGLDGLELLERIHDRQLDIRVVLVSGYADFQYAQKAIRLGAFDYLLKQIDKHKLEETVRRLTDDLQSRRQAMRELDLFLDDLFDLLEPDNRVTVGDFLENRGIHTDLPHLRFLNCLFPEATTALAATGATPAEPLQAIRLRTGQNKLSVLLFYDEQQYPLDFLNYISGNLADARHIGISSRGNSAASLSRLYQEADIAMFSSAFYGAGQVMRYKPKEISPELRRSVLNLEIFIKESNREEIARRISLIGETCKQQLVSVDEVAILYNQIISLLFKYHGHSGGTADLDLLSYDNVSRYYSSPNDLFGRLIDFFEHASEEKVYLPSGQAKRILEYIDESFTEDLLLSDVARKFRISIGYVSSLIKRETGSTYTDYVTAKRLALARELLADPSLSIQDIVQRVGYKDYFHFNKLFKKHLGVTPSKYRKL